MSLFFAELRKVWGSRVFPLLLAVLASANLLLLWMGTRPTANQPPAAAYRAVGEELQGKTMEEKGTFLHGKLTEYESLIRIDNYYRELAWGGSYMQSWREENAELFDEYEQEYNDKSCIPTTSTSNICCLPGCAMSMTRWRGMGISWTVCRPRRGGWRESRFFSRIRPGMT